jgi:hypothetical protein
VDSPAYADLDWKMELAGEVGSTQQDGEEKVEPEPPEDESQSPPQNTGDEQSVPAEA